MIKNGLEDKINARVLRSLRDLSDLELQELDFNLNSQIEQLESQIENEVRVIPKENNVGEKPVLVILEQVNLRLEFSMESKEQFRLIRQITINNWEQH